MNLEIFEISMIASIVVVLIIPFIVISYTTIKDLAI